jgi:hypothetical protein
MKSKVEGPGEAVLAGMGVRAVAGLNGLGIDALPLTPTVAPASRSGFFNKYGVDRVLKVSVRP